MPDIPKNIGIVIDAIPIQSQLTGMGSLFFGQNMPAL
jgi:hypothetical protein